MIGHITNILKVSGDTNKVKDMFEEIKIDEIGYGSIDFVKIIPMPFSLEIESESRINRAMKLYLDFCAEKTAIIVADAIKSIESYEYYIAELIKKYEEITKNDPELLQLGEQCYECIQSYIRPTLHQWREWNEYAYGNNEKDFNAIPIKFQTIWSSAFPIIAALAERYSELTFEINWADEDIGYEVGKKKYARGIEIYSYIPENYSKEAMEMAAEIHNVKLEDEGYIYNKSTNKYEYHVPEEARTLISRQ